MAESAESSFRFGNLFHKKFHRFAFFDGSSLTHPSSSVQIIHPYAYLNASNFLPLLPQPSLVKGAAYVASDCHNRQNARNQLVAAIKAANFRVDGLGKCFHTKNIPEGYKLSTLPEDRYNAAVKIKVIRHYMFTLAFENTVEPGYVTEKVFDALNAGKNIQYKHLLVVVYMHTSTVKYLLYGSL